MDDAEPQPWDDLVDALLDVACEMIETHGGFAPFGGGILMNGETVHFQCNPEDSEPEDDLADLAEALRNPDFATGVILMDTRVVPPGATAVSDAIWIIVENLGGPAIHVFWPYTTDGGFELGEEFQPDEVRPVIYVAREGS